MNESKGDHSFTRKAAKYSLIVSKYSMPFLTCVDCTYSLEAVISHRHWEFFESRKVIHMFVAIKNFQVDPHSNSFPSFQQFGVKHVPSDNILRECFLSKFMEDKQTYIVDIQSIKPGEILSFDHTFKITSNIGCLRSGYASMIVHFLYLMEGKILSWQFSKGTNFDNVRSLLQNKKRSEYHNVPIKAICIDNCCQWRQNTWSFLLKCNCYWMCFVLSISYT